MSFFDHFLYALLWLGFAVVHSLTARASFKARMEPWLHGTYRLAYNGFAVLHFLAISAIAELWLGGNSARFDFPPGLSGSLMVMKFTGIAVFLAALFHYDLGLFSGVKQALSKSAVLAEREAEPLNLSGLHRYVRHPIYTGALLYLWGGVSDELTLATAIWASLYLLIGSRFEERALVRQYGDAYSGYIARVPALVPWKGRVQF